MSAANVLFKLEECTMLLVDFQAGLGFGAESIPRQLVVNNAVGLARTAVAFKVPVIASISASRVYSGPLLPALQEALPAVKPIERRSMNVWENDTARNAVVATNRRRLILAGSLQKPVYLSRRSAEGWLRSVRCWRRLRRLDPTKP